MKFIRTKDKIIKLSDEYVIRDGEAGLPFYGTLLESINGVIAEADTIEELCDEFVIVPKDKNIKPYFTATLAVFDDVKSLLTTDDIYGAIWTDKGLIYKAKMRGVLPNGAIDWELLWLKN